MPQNPVAQVWIADRLTQPGHVTPGPAGENAADDRLAMTVPAQRPAVCIPEELADMGWEVHRLESTPPEETASGVVREACSDPGLLLVEVDPHHLPLAHADKVVDEPGLALLPDEHHADF